MIDTMLKAVSKIDWHPIKKFKPDLFQEALGWFKSGKRWLKTEDLPQSVHVMSGAAVEKYFDALISEIPVAKIINMRSHEAILNSPELKEIRGKSKSRKPLDFFIYQPALNK